MATQQTQQTQHEHKKHAEYTLLRNLLYLRIVVRGVSLVVVTILSAKRGGGERSGVAYFLLLTASA